ncbi:MAG: MFS transporter, partial [Bacteroidales bacterium]|nr:MFS transporter [Bacteroidales bacterium]
MLWLLAFFWGVNGWFQSMGFPPIAKNLSYWFSNKERGFKWSLWSSSHEVGTYISVILSGYLITHYGWESVFYVPAIFSIIFCWFFYKNLQDKPASIGLPDIEKYKDRGCKSLIGGNGTKYDDFYTDKTYAIIDGTDGNPGYLTDGSNGIKYKIFYRGVTKDPDIYDGTEEVTLYVPTDAYFKGWKQTVPTTTSTELVTKIPAGSTGHREFTAVWEAAFKIRYVNEHGTQTTAEFDNLVDAMTLPSDISTVNKTINVSLLRNYKSPSSDAEEITIPEGYTYGVYFNSRFSNSEGELEDGTMEGSYKFTIDGTLNVAGDNTKTTLAAYFQVQSGGSLNISGGTYKQCGSNNFVIQSSENATTTINSGILGDGNVNFALYNANGSTITIKGGRFEGKNAAIQNLGTITLGDFCNYYAISKTGDTETKNKITSASPYAIITASRGWLVDDNGDYVKVADVTEGDPNFTATFKDASGTEQTLKFLTLEEALNDLNYNISTTSGEYTFPGDDNPVTITQLCDEYTLASRTEPLVLGYAEENTGVLGVSKYVLDLKKITFNDVTLQLGGTLEIKDITATDAAMFKGTLHSYCQLEINGGSFKTVSIEEMYGVIVRAGTFTYTGDNAAFTYVSVIHDKDGNMGFCNITGGTFGPAGDLVDGKGTGLLVKTTMVRLSGGTFKGGKAAIEKQSTATSLLATNRYYFEGDDVTHNLGDKFNTNNLLVNADNQVMKKVTVAKFGAYAIITGDDPDDNDGGKVFTFKYGIMPADGYPINECEEFSYTTYSVYKSSETEWKETEIPNSVTKVVFDESFDAVRPTSCFEWFYDFKNLKTIVNMDKYLHTDNVLDMYRMFYNCNSLQSITFGEHFYTANVMFMGDMFYGCSSLKTLDLSIFNTQSVTDYKFPGDPENADEGYGMSSMFNGCKLLETLTLGDNFKPTTYAENSNGKPVGGIVTLSWMFANCEKLASIDLSHFGNMAEIVDMTCLFYYCKALTSIKVSDDINTAKVTDMSYMFLGCESLPSAVVQEIIAKEGFSTAAVKNMYSMFCGCSSENFTSLDLSKFNTGMVGVKQSEYEAQGSMHSMFSGCSNLETIKFSSTFTTANVPNMYAMFEDCEKLKVLDLKSFNTANVTDMYHMFWNCKSLTAILVDNDGWSTTKLTDGYQSTQIFAGCDNLVGEQGTVCPKIVKKYDYLPVSFTNVQNEEDFNKDLAHIDGGTDNPGYLSSSYGIIYDLAGGTNNADNPTKLPGSEDPDVVLKTPKKEGYDFIGWTGGGHDDPTKDIIIPAGTVGNFKFTAHWEKSTAYVVYDEDTKTLTFMNDGNIPTSGTYFYLNEGTETPGWIENDYDREIEHVVFHPSFASARPTTCLSWFARCSKITELDLSNLNTSETKDMFSMFSGCSSLTTLDVTSFNTDKVTNMAFMFEYCSSLTTLDLTSFNTANVTEMYGMFGQSPNLTPNLTTILVSPYKEDVVNGETVKTGWIAGDNVNDSRDMFTNCTALVGGNGTKYNSAKIDKSYAHIDGGTANPGYLTSTEQNNMWTVKFYASNKTDATVVATVSNVRNGLTIAESQVTIPSTLADAKWYYKDNDNNRVRWKFGETVVKSDLNLYPACLVFLDGGSNNTEFAGTNKPDANNLVDYGSTVTVKFVDGMFDKDNEVASVFYEMSDRSFIYGTQNSDGNFDIEIKEWHVIISNAKVNKITSMPYGSTLTADDMEGKYNGNPPGGFVDLYWTTPDKTVEFNNAHECTTCIEDISKATSGNYTLTAIFSTEGELGRVIQPVEIVPAKPAAPSVVFQNGKICGKNDGSILGVSTAMEYSTDGTNYTAITAADITQVADPNDASKTVPALTGLAIGETGTTYYVRYAATTDGNYTASDPASQAIVHGEEHLAVTYDFQSNLSGSNYTDNTICYGGTATQPTGTQIPKYAGHTLTGWYTASDYSESTKWDFATNTVTNSMTLYAKWEKTQNYVKIYANPETNEPNMEFTSDAKPDEDGYINPGSTVTFNFKDNADKEMAASVLYRQSDDTPYYISKNNAGDYEVKVDVDMYIENLLVTKITSITCGEDLPASMTYKWRGQVYTGTEYSLSNRWTHNDEEVADITKAAPGEYTLTTYFGGDIVVGAVVQNVKVLPKTITKAAITALIAPSKTYDGTAYALSTGETLLDGNTNIKVHYADNDEVDCKIKAEFVDASDNATSSVERKAKIHVTLDNSDFTGMDYMYESTEFDITEGAFEIAKKTLTVKIDDNAEFHFEKYLGDDNNTIDMTIQGVSRDDEDYSNKLSATENYGKIFTLDGIVSGEERGVSAKFKGGTFPDYTKGNYYAGEKVSLEVELSGTGNGDNSGNYTVADWVGDNQIIHGMWKMTFYDADGNNSSSCYAEFSNTIPDSKIPSLTKPGYVLKWTTTLGDENTMVALENDGYMVTGDEVFYAYWLDDAPPIVTVSYHDIGTNSTKTVTLDDVTVPQGIWALYGTDVVCTPSDVANSVSSLDISDGSNHYVEDNGDAATVRMEKKGLLTWNIVTVDNVGNETTPSYYTLDLHVMTLPTAKENLRYNGEPQELITPSDGIDDFEFEYKVDRLSEDGASVVSAGTYYTAIPTATAIGKYNVYYKSAATDSHIEVAETMLTAEITTGKYPAPSVVFNNGEICGKADGSIYGVSTAMEISTDGTNYTPIAAADIAQVADPNDNTNTVPALTGLTIGETGTTYYIRVAASADGYYEASDPVSQSIVHGTGKLTVTYDFNVASLSTANYDDASLCYESTATEPTGTQIPTYAGHSLTGWYTDATCSEGNEWNFATDKVTDDVRLYAKWEVNEYDITYDLDGGSLAEGESNPGTYTVESEDITLNNPTKADYNFVGWLLDGESAASLSVTIAHGSTGVRHYTAQWEASEYA